MFCRRINHFVETKLSSMHVFTVCAIEENINTQPLTSDQENYVTNMQA